MGKRGPTPMPTVIAKQKGNYRPSRHGDVVAKVDAIDFVYSNIPHPPAHLNNYAASIWNQQLMQAYKVYGYISFLDLKLFEQYCEVYGEIETIKYQNISRTFVDKSGNIRINPLYKELNMLRRDFQRLSAEFGFSPSARTRVPLQQQDNKGNEQEFEL